jgi:diaminopimelate decarboxylase
LVANTTAIIARVEDIVDTGRDGYTFLRIGTGMNDILRPAMYGAQHPLIIVKSKSDDETKETTDYVVVGHCCESSDVVTISPDGAHNLAPRKLQKTAIGDYIVIEGAGAYCQSMSAVGYNGYPPTKAVFVE